MHDVPDLISNPEPLMCYRGSGWCSGTMIAHLDNAEAAACACASLAVFLFIKARIEHTHTHTHIGNPVPHVSWPEEEDSVCKPVGADAALSDVNILQWWLQFLMCFFLPATHPYPVGGCVTQQSVFCPSKSAGGGGGLGRVLQQLSECIRAHHCFHLPSPGAVPSFRWIWFDAVTFLSWKQQSFRRQRQIEFRLTEKEWVIKCGESCVDLVFLQWAEYNLIHTPIFFYHKGKITVARRSWQSAGGKD